MTRLLNSREWARQHVWYYAGLVKRLEMMRAAGLPPMRVVAAAEIERLGRIPRSTDTDAKVEDALDVVERCGSDRTGKPNAILTFFSHQWLRPNWCEAKGADLAWGSPERAQAAATMCRPTATSLTSATAGPGRRQPAFLPGSSTCSLG